MDRVSGASLQDRTAEERTAKTSGVNREETETTAVQIDDDPVAVWSAPPTDRGRKASFRKMRMQTLAAPRLFRFVSMSPLAQAVWWQLWSAGGPLRRFKDGRVGVVLYGSLTFAANLANRVGRSERQVRRSLAELEEAGMVSRRRIVRGYCYQLMIPDALANELMSEVETDKASRVVQGVETAAGDGENDDDKGIRVAIGPDPDRAAKLRHLLTTFTAKTAERLVDTPIVRSVALDHLSFAVSKASKSGAQNPAGLLRSWINAGDLPKPRRDRLPSERQRSNLQLEGGKSFAEHRRLERDATSIGDALDRLAGLLSKAKTSQPVDAERAERVNLAAIVLDWSKASPAEAHAMRDAASRRQRDRIASGIANQFHPPEANAKAIAETDDDPDAVRQFWRDEAIVGFVKPPAKTSTA